MDENQKKPRPPGRKPGPGRLDEHEATIFSMLSDPHRTYTTAQIQDHLKEVHGVEVAWSTLYGFIARRTKKRRERLERLGGAALPVATAPTRDLPLKEKSRSADKTPMDPNLSRRSSIAKSGSDESEIDKLMREAGSAGVPWKNPKK